MEYLDCNSIYIKKIGRKLKIRLDEHNQDANKNDCWSILTKHMSRDRFGKQESNVQRTKSRVRESDKTKRC